MSNVVSPSALRAYIGRRFLVGVGLISIGMFCSMVRGQVPSSAAGLDESKGMAGEILNFDPVDARERDVVSRDLDAVAKEISDLESRLNSARPIESAAELRIEPKKKSIESIKSDLDLAKKEKREADARRLEEIKKRTELELRYLERVAQMQAADVERLEKCKAFAEARKKALDLESMIAERRAALEVLPEGDPKAATRRAELYEFEKQALAAIQEAAEKGSDAAGKAKDLAGKRNEVYETIAEYRKLR